MLNTQVADQEQEINFVWPKIMPGRRPDKGGFTVPCYPKSINDELSCFN